MKAIAAFAVPQSLAAIPEASSVLIWLGMMFTADAASPSLIHGSRGDHAPAGNAGRGVFSQSKIVVSDGQSAGSKV